MEMLNGLVLMRTLEIPIGSNISRLCSYAAIKGAVPKASGTALALSAKTNPESLNIGYFKIVIIAGVATVLCWEMNGLLRGLSYGSLEIAKDLSHSLALYINSQRTAFLDRRMQPVQSQNDLTSKTFREDRRSRRRALRRPTKEGQRAHDSAPPDASCR